MQNTIKTDNKNIKRRELSKCATKTIKLMKENYFNFE